METNRSRAVHWRARVWTVPEVVVILPFPDHPCIVTYIGDINGVNMFIPDMDGVGLWCFPHFQGGFDRAQH